MRPDTDLYRTFKLQEAFKIYWACEMDFFSLHQKKNINVEDIHASALLILLIIEVVKQGWSNLSVLGASLHCKGGWERLAWVLVLVFFQVI